MADPSALVRRLGSPRRTEQLKAATELARLAAAGSPAACHQLAVANCVPPLLALLSSGSQALQEVAVAALAWLTEESQRAQEDSAAGIPALVAMLSSSAASEVALDHAATVLGRLALESPARCAAIVAAGGPSAVLQLCASDSPAVRDAASFAVCSMASDVPSRAACRDAGAFAALVAVLQRAADSSSAGSSGDSASSASSSSSAAARAADAIANLCLDADRGTNVTATAAATAAGAPEALVALLRRSCGGHMLDATIRAIFLLAYRSDPGTCSAIAAAGGAGVLAHHLCCSSLAPQALEAVTGTLARLAFASRKECADLAAYQGLVPRLVQLLGSADAGEARAAATLSCSLAAAGQLAPLRDAGFDAHFQQMAASSDADVRQMATEILPALARPLSGPAAEAVKPASQRQRLRRRTCDGPNCSATHGLRLCGGCGTVRYCGEACSRAHWREHRAECRRVQAEKAAAAAASGDGASGNTGESTATP